MHRLAAELLHEPLGVLFRSKPEDLIPFLFPSDRVSKPRQRKPLLPAKALDLFVIGAGALFVDQAHPIGETPLIGFRSAFAGVTLAQLTGNAVRLVR